MKWVVAEKLLIKSVSNKSLKDQSDHLTYTEIINLRENVVALEPSGMAFTDMRKVAIYVVFAQRIQCVQLYS